MMRKYIMKSIWFILIFVPILFLFPVRDVEAKGISFSDIELKDDETPQTIIINDDTIDYFSTFVSNSQTNSYSNTTIVFALNEYLILDSSFTGIGSADYPFEGTIKTTNLTIKNRSGHTLFNNLSTKASFIGDSTLNIQTTGATTLTDVLTIVDGHNLNLNKIRFTAGTSLSLSSSGVIANTILGSGTVTITADEILTGISSISLSSSGYAGFIAGELISGVNLTAVVPNSISLSATGATNLGGIFGNVLGDLTVSNASSITLSGANHIGGIASNLKGSLICSGALSISINANGNAGGLAASTENGSTITATSLSISGSITGKSYVGGIVGNNDGELTLNTFTISSSITGFVTGGVIGKSNANSNLSGTLTLSGNITSSGTDSISGGVIGDAQLGTSSLNATVGSNVSIKADSYTGGMYGIYSTDASMLEATFAITGTVKGNGIVGAYIGKFYNKVVTTLTDENLTMNPKATEFNANSQTVGCYIGYLDTSADFTFNQTKATTTSKLGMFGTIHSDNISRTITINGGNKTYTGNTLTGKEGVIASLIDSNTYVYIHSLNATCNVTSIPMVYTLSENSILNVGTSTYKNSNGSIFLYEISGKAAIRFTGTLTTNKFQHLVRTAGTGLVFCEEGFVLSRGDAIGFDIGDHGVVIRNEEIDSEKLINFNTTNHSVSIHQLTYSSTYTIRNEKDAILLYISLSTKGNYTAFSSKTYQNLLLNTNYKLGASLDLSYTGIDSFQNTASGTGDTDFTGTFDGNNKTITIDIGRDITNISRQRIYICPSYIGLFTRANSAKFKDLTITGTMNVKNSSGALRPGILASCATTITVTNVTSTVNYQIATNGGDSSVVGGFFGLIYGGTNTISGCTVGSGDAKVSVEATGSCLIGGLIGEIRASSVTFSSCNVYVNLNTPANCGGVIAKLNNAKNITINGSSVIDAITVGKWNNGGIIGAAENCSTTNITIQTNTITTNLTATSATNTGGIIGGYPSGTGSSNSITISNNTINTIVSTDGNAGGIIGGVVSETKLNTLTISNNTITATITASKYSGFLLGSYENDATLDFSSNTISSSSITSNSTTGQAGGICGYLVSTNLKRVTLTGTTLAGTITENSTLSSYIAGGFLGYYWKNTEVFLDGSHSLSVSSSGRTGGIFGVYEGVLVIESTFSNTGTIGSTSSSTSAFIAVNANKEYASMIFIKCSFGSLFSNATTIMNGTDKTKYDLVITSQKNDAGTIASEGALVSIEYGGTEGSMLNMPDAWKTFLSKVANRSSVRYYFNTYTYFYNGTDSYKKAVTFTSASDLVYWHLRDYLFNNSCFKDSIKNTFYNNTVSNTINIASAMTINLSDYCLYPTKKTSATLSFSNSTINFGITNETIATKATNSSSQFFGLQYGFLMGLSSSDSVASSLSVSNVIFTGTFYSNANYSGLLIVDSISGYYSSTVEKTSTLSLSNITLAGIKNKDTSNALLIRSIGTQLTGTITTIIAYNSSNACYYSDTNKAASALFYSAGSNEANNLTLTFSDIRLDSIMFTDALFFESLLANTNSKVTYNFEISEDWDSGNHIKHVTYGQELDKEDQEFYWNSSYYTSPSGNFAVDPSFASYLPYCGNADIAYTWFYVNRKKPNLNIGTGFGTHENPYIINHPGQLALIADILEDENNITDGFTINFPVDVSKPTKYGIYTYENGSFQKDASSPNTVNSINKTTVQSWLQQAYYSIVLSDGITELHLDSQKYLDFIGIGTYTHPFYGVIDGNGATVVMPRNLEVNNLGHSYPTHGSGFINVAKGCALYDITINYQNILYQDDATTFPSAVTNASAGGGGTDYFYFGGAIGWSIGGDSSIAKTSVTFTSSSTITVNNKTSIFGGLVGLVSYGGIILGDSNSSTLESSTNDSIYFNKYIGKVDNGYVIHIKDSSSGEGYDNTNLYDDTWTQYKINTLTTNLGAIAYTAQDDGSIKISITTSEEFFILSLITSSGILQDSAIFSAGRSRYNAYSHVGTNTSVTNGLYTQDKSVIYPYVAKYLANSFSTSLNYRIELSSSATYDLSSYGNAFRGIGRLNDRNKVFNLVSVLGNNATIKVASTYKQYYCASAIEKDNMAYLGIFGYSKNATFQSFSVIGSLELIHLQSDGTAPMKSYGTACYLGAITGKAESCIFNNITLGGSSENSLSLLGPDYVGGLSGHIIQKNQTDVSTTGITLNYIRFISYGHIGGLYGYFKANSVNEKITNTKVMNSSILSLSDNDGQNHYSGGFIGYADGTSTGSLTILGTGDNPTKVISTNIIGYNINARSGANDVGGFVGYAKGMGNITVSGTILDSSSLVSMGNSGYTPSLSSLLVKTNEATLITNMKAWIIGSINRGYTKNAIGGVIGRLNCNGTITNFTLSTDSRETILIGTNDSSGVVGEIQADNVALTVTNSQITATNNHMYILGVSRACGVLGANEKTSSGALTITNVTVSGNQNTKKEIFFVSSYNNAKGFCAASGLVGALKSNGAVNISGCTLKELVLLSKTSSAILSLNTSGSVSVTNTKIDSCFIYGINFSSALTAYQFTSQTATNIEISNTIISGQDSTYGGIITANTQDKNITGSGFMLHNVTVGSGTFKKSSGTQKTGDDIQKTIVDLVISCQGVSNLKANSNSTYTNGNFGYLVSNYTGKITLYDIVRSEVSDTPASNTDLPIFKNATNAIGYFVGYSRFNASSSNNFGAYANYAIGGYNPANITTIIDAYMLVDTLAEGSIKGDQQVKTNSSLFLSDYLNSNTISNQDYHISSNNKVECISMNSLGLTFSDSTTLQNASIYKIQSNKNMIHDDLVEYLDLLSFGGFGSVYTIDKTMISVSSVRYIFTNGEITKDLTSSGSIKYSSNGFEFDQTSGYDTISDPTAASKTFTILFITITDGSYSYSFSILLYYEQILDMESYTVPLVGENYVISKYFSSTRGIKLSSNESLSLYIEYAYSDVAKNIDTNIDKKIISVDVDGNLCSTAIPEGTKCKLVDISSSTPAGYKVYYYQLTSDMNVLEFSNFTYSASAIDYINLSDLIVPENKISTTYSNIERYILILEFPEAEIETAINYYLVADETTRNNIRIQHNKGDGVETNFHNFTKSVQLLPSPTADIDIDYTASDISLTFSNTTDPLDFLVDENITATSTYMEYASGKTLYGVYEFSLVDADSRLITFPYGTELIIRKGANKITLDASLVSTLTYSIGNVISLFGNNEPYSVDEDLTVSIDFSKVSSIDFNTTFHQGYTYTLHSYFYLAASEEFYTTGTKYTLSTLSYTANIVTGIKVSMIPDNAKNLGINVSPVEMSDTTNSGEISFKVTADFQTLDESEIPENATLSFTLYRKAKVGDSYTYIPYSQNLPDGIIEGFGNVYDGTTLANSISVDVNSETKLLEKNLTYKISFPKNADGTVNTSQILLTSYKLVVTVSYGDGNTQSTFFIFLVVDINTN